MAISIQCPNPSCRHVINGVPDDKAGRLGKCPKCGDRFTIRPFIERPTTTDEAVQTKIPSSEGATAPRIGRFLLRAKLGSGAFGAVYRAYDPQLDREVAVKVPHPGTLENPRAVERFLREAKTAAQLRHPNIVPVYDAGQDGEFYYIASAFIRGETLAHLIADGRRPDLLASSKIIADLADALAYAHSLGIVHRDIKPENVLIDERGHALLTDFGLAHRHDSGETMTATGAILGTPAYMAPEQAAGRGQEVLPASDQYALGVMLYELLCGQRPFGGPTHAILYQAIHTEPKTPSSIDPDVPKPLEAVCLKTMAKAPEGRHDSCEVLAAILRGWREQERMRGVATPAPPPPPPEIPIPTSQQSEPKGTPRRIAVGLLVLGLVATGFVVWSRVPPALDPSSLPKETSPVATKSKGQTLPSDPVPPKASVQASSPAPAPAPDAEAKEIGAVTVTVPDLDLDPTTSAPAPTATSEPPITVAVTKKSADVPPPKAPPVVAKKDDREITNSIGMKLALIPAGSFAMGSDDTDKNAENDEKPRHTVRITRPFYLGVHEVTVGEFRRFVADADFKTDAEKGRGSNYGFDQEKGEFESDLKYNWRNPGFPQSDDHPVVLVSYNDALAFCEWLSRKETQSYRLPTEAEWEYACRAGTATIYPNGDDPERLALIANLADASFKRKVPTSTGIAADDGHAFTAPVGSYAENAFKLKDMIGDVWEWCSDGYDADYYKQSPPDDPPGISGAPYRVNRGGSFNITPAYARSALRSRYAPGSRYIDLGFRVARVQSGN